MREHGDAWHCLADIGFDGFQQLMSALDCPFTGDQYME